MIRLDKAVQYLIEQKYGIKLPRSSINRLLQAGAAWYNGEVIKKKGFKFESWEEAQNIKLNDELVKAAIEEYTTGKVRQEYARMWDQSAPIGHFDIRREYIEKVPDASDDVIFKDNNYLVLYKPPGVISHPAQRDDVDNMVYRFLKYVQTVDKVIPRGGLLHRLDKDTQGIMIFALNLFAFNHLKQQFSSNQVIKLYIAAGIDSGSVTRFGKRLQGMCKREDLNEFLQLWRSVNVKHTPGGIYTEKSDEIFKYILNKPSLPMEGYIAMYRYENKAKFAFDKASLKKRIFRKLKDAASIIYPLGYMGDIDLYWFAVRLLTGRTHQIRAQSKAMGLPLLGDEIYTPVPLQQKFMKRVAQVWGMELKDKINLHLVSAGLSFLPPHRKERLYIFLPIEKVQLFTLKS